MRVQNQFDCFICSKHRGKITVPGDAIFENDLIFHVHLVPRYPGTPREYWGMQVDEWPDAPKGDLATTTALTTRPRTYL